MTEDFFNFIQNTTKKNFINSQNVIISNKEYNPYSEDLSIMEELLDVDKYNEVIEYNNINILLSPRAHLFKNYALEKINKPKDATFELIFAQKIMEGISLTGNGSKTSPYLITRISDEKDLLNYLQEDFKSQSLIKEGDTFLDLIICQSEKKIYFDITTPYLKMQELMNNGKIKSPLDLLKEKEEKKKWWEFWK